LGEVLVAGDPSVFKGKLLEKVFLVNLFTPAARFIVCGPVHYLEPSLYSPYSVVKAVIARVIGYFFNKPIFDRLKDGVKEVVFDISGIAEKLI
jgi:hypothetical protein